MRPSGAKRVLLAAAALAALVIGWQVRQSYHERRLHDLRAGLGAPGWRERAAAADALGATGDPRVIDDLIRAAFDADDDVRKAARAGLARFGAAPASRLVARLEGDYQEKTQAAEALAAIGVPALPAVGALLDSPDWERRAWGVGVLGRMGARAPVPPLAAALGDPVWTVREAAVLALSGIDDPSATKALASALRDEHDTVRAAAAKGLARYGRGDAVAPLVQALGDGNTLVWGAASLSLEKVLERDPVTAPLVPALAHPSPIVRQAAAELLGRHGGPALASSFLPLLKDPDETVRNLAIAALGRWKARDAVPSLIAALRDRSRDRRTAAIAALGEIGDPRAAAPLLRLASRVDLSREAVTAVLRLPGGPDALAAWWPAASPVARQFVLPVLGKTNDRRAWEVLVDASRDPDPWMRQEAMAALRERPEREANVILEAGLSDASGEVRRVAGAALDARNALTPEMLVRAFKRSPSWPTLEPGGTVGVSLLWSMAPRVVAPLVAALRDESPQLRSAAAQSLGRILADDAVEPLCVAMRDPDINVRTEAARALGRIGDRRATGVLVTEVGNPSGARCEAARALAGLADPTAREGLRWAAESCLEDVRALAMETLGTLGDTGATPLLEAAVASPRPIVRIAAIRALGRLGRKPDPQPLVALAVDTDYWVSTSARAALEELRDPRAVPGLLDVLARAPFASGPLVTTLCRLGDPRALPAVLDLLTREDAEERDERGYVRDLVAQGLGGFGAAAVEPVVALLRSRADFYVADAAAHLPREATPPLLALLDDGSATPESRAAAARALGAIGSPTAVGPLIKALRDEDLQVRSSAAAALGLLKAAEAEEPLIEALKDPQWPLHREAAEALGELRSQKAVPQLLNVLADTTNIACTGAARALGEIGDRRAVPGLIAALAADPPDGNLHLSALIALGEIADPSASRTLVENLGQAAARDVAHRVAAGISDPAVIPDLLKLLDTGRSVAAAALARMDDPRARSRLEAAYARREWATLCSAARFFIEQGTPGSEDVLVEALNRCGFDDMANDFFGSGNPKLRSAALRRSRYYSNVAPPVASPSGPRWGTHER